MFSKVGSARRSWRHDQDGVDNGLGSDSRGVLGHPPDLFGPNTLAAQYLMFAVMVHLFVVVLIGPYCFVMVPSGRDGGGRTRPVGTPKGVLLVNPEC